MEKSRVKNIIVIAACLILGVVFIFLLWELLSLISQNDFIVPSISNTMKALGEILTKSDTYNILFSTILRLLSSITICFILSLTLAPPIITTKGLVSSFKIPSNLVISSLTKKPIPLGK